MFRRARLSVKPNVRPPAAARGAPAAPSPGTRPPPAEEEPPPGVQAQDTEPHEHPLTESNKEEKNGSGNDCVDSSKPCVDSSKPSSAPLQRRKRISTTPNIVKPRASVPTAQQPSTSASKASQRQTPQVPPNSSVSLENEVPPPAKNASPINPKSPVALKPTVGQHNSLPEKRTPVPHVPHFSPFKKSAIKELKCSTPKGDGMFQKGCPPPLRERPTQEGCQHEETAASSKPTCEKAKQESDRERILKAQKLRELLRKELRKERKDWKEKYPILESTPPDRSRMTMRDLIYYLPDSNPMKSAVDQEKKPEKSPPVKVPAKEPEEKSIPEPEDEEEVDENSEGPLLVPRVKVAEDGTIILDEESLTVEVLRMKGPIVEENDPIFERGSTTTYSSFRKSCYSKPWSNKETDLFFLAISMVGTDFSMIGQLFPHRTRLEIKNKFKREERSSGWRIDKAFSKSFGDLKRKRLT